MAEGGGFLFEDRGDVAFGGGEAEIGGEGNFQAGEVDGLDGVNVGGLADGFAVDGGGERVRRVVADDGAEQEGGVGDGAAHGADDGQAAVAVDPAFGGDKAGGGAEADNAAEGGGVAQRAAGVGALAERGHAGGEGDGGASGGAGA